MLIRTTPLRVPCVLQSGQTEAACVASLGKLVSPRSSTASANPHPSGTGAVRVHSQSHGPQCVAARRGRSAAGPAWLVKAPRAGTEGQTNPLRHRLLYTDSPCEFGPQLTCAPPGRGTDRVLGSGGAVAVRHLGAEMWICLWSRGGYAPVRRSRRHGWRCVTGNGLPSSPF